MSISRYIHQHLASGRVGSTAQHHEAIWQQKLANNKPFEPNTALSAACCPPLDICKQLFIQKMKVCQHEPVVDRCIMLYSSAHNPDENGNGYVPVTDYGVSI